MIKKPIINYFELISDNLSSVQKLWVKFASEDRDKCIWCKKKFKKPIVIKNSKQLFPTDVMYMFTAEFLVHAQQTHGFTPDTLQVMFNKLNNDKETN